jgi:paraquat-inducible protein B
VSDDATSATDSQDESIVPEAIVETSSRRSLFIWLVPLLAIMVTTWVSLDAWFARGPQVQIEFLEAHGLEAGDPVRCRGVEVGRIDAVDLDWSNDPGRVRITASLEKDAARLLRAGTRFWIQHPEFDFGGIRGLDTVVGPRYLAVVPGAGAIDDGPFIGLNRSPVVTDASPGDLEIIVESSERAGMRRGGMVSYRGMPAGRILDVELASDSTRVRATVSIKSRYAPLVRSGTRFFSISGVAFEFGLDGFRTDVDSLESIIAGCIGFATPPDAGAAAVTGARFQLASKLDVDWLEWSPAIASGDLSSESPPKVRAILRWKSGLLRRPKSKKGWLTLLPDGLLVVPTTLVTAPDSAIDPTLEFGGISRPLASLEIRESSVPEEFRFLRASDLPSEVTDQFVGDARPLSRQEIELSETLLVHGGASTGPIPLDPGRWSKSQAGYRIDSQVGLTADHSGCAVTEAGSGRLIGFLVITDDTMSIMRASAVEDSGK